MNLPPRPLLFSALVGALGFAGLLPASADPTPSPVATFRVISVTESRPSFSNYPPRTGVDDIYGAMSADGTVLIGNACLWSTGGIFILGGDHASTEAPEARVKAFRRIGDVREELGPLPQASSQSSDALGISGDGTVIVGAAGEAFGSRDAGAEAFRWTAADGMQRLFPTPFANSAATGASTDGAVIAGSYTAPGSEFTRAFRWTASGTTSLAPLPGDMFSSGECISSDGSTVAGISAHAGGYRACRWAADGSALALGPLPGFDRLSGPTAISADGSVIVGQANSDETYVAFRWTADGGIRRLGTATPSSARAVSADGSVVVGSSNGNAFRWDATHGVQPLADLLAAAGADLGNVHLDEAVAISADGTTIMGRGTLNVAGIPENRPPTATWIACLPTLPEFPVTDPDAAFSATPPADEPPVLGKIKTNTRNSRVLVAGIASGDISRILYRIGTSGRYRLANGTTSWRFTAPVRSSRRGFTVIAEGPGGRSEPATVSIPRK